MIAGSSKIVCVFPESVHVTRSPPHRAALTGDVGNAEQFLADDGTGFAINKFANHRHSPAGNDRNVAQ
jgi:hypothetical protein